MQAGFQATYHTLSMHKDRLILSENKRKTVVMCYNSFRVGAATLYDVKDCYSLLLSFAILKKYF